MENTRYYEHCISLGWFCGTASSLARLGLRGFSSPFDWMFSDLDQVIDQIEHRFIDFMKKENLEVVADDPKVFIDKKYGFYCNHDIKENFETEYADIYVRYSRRAKRFLESVKEPTCFFRAVRSEEEIRYIREHADHIEHVLKRYNPQNTIVYILLEDMDPLPDDFVWFRLSLKQYGTGIFEMRTMFDRSKGLSEFCQTLLREEAMEQNRKYDIKKNGQMEVGSVVDDHVQNGFEGIDRKIADLLDLRDDEAFYIWGGGNNGTHLYRYLIKRDIHVKAIIDNRPKSGFPDDLFIISPNEMEDRSKIFIAIGDESACYQIKEQMKDKKCTFYTYRELLPLCTFLMSGL